MAVAAGICVLLVACSRHEGVFSLSPVFTARSALSAPALTQCVVQHWEQGTRGVHRGNSDGTLTLRAQSFFNGSAIGLRVVPEGRQSRVEYFERRHTDSLYESMVRECLRSDGGDAPDVPSS